MTKFLFHIGTHKTGTTSIQRFLSQNQDYLLEESVLFPQSGRSRPLSGQHKLAWSILRINDIKDEQCWLDLFEEVKSFKPEKVVLSAEGFSACNRKQIQRVGEIIGENEVRIIVYLRNQFSYLLSDYKETIKAGKYRKDFRDYIGNHIEKCNYPSLIQRWKDVFGIENLDIRLFDETIQKKGLIPDFFECIDVDLPGVKNNIRINKSPSDGSILIIRNLNELEKKLNTKIFEKPFQGLRKSIIKEKSIFKVISNINQKIFNQSLYSKQDLLWIRNQVSAWNDALFDIYIDAENRKYFEF